MRTPWAASARARERRAAALRTGTRRRGARPLSSPAMDLVAPTRTVANVRDLVNAVEHAADGDVIAIAPGEYALPPDGLHVRNAITLIGANPSPNRIRNGTRIRPAVENGYGIVVTPEDGNVTIANLTISPGRQQTSSIMPRAGILI